jgi:hypothetical protein
LSPISRDNWGRRYNIQNQDILIDNTVKHAGVMEGYIYSQTVLACTVIDRNNTTSRLYKMTKIHDCEEDLSRGQREFPNSYLVAFPEEDTLSFFYDHSIFFECTNCAMSLTENLRNFRPIH